MLRESKINKPGAYAQLGRTTPFRYIWTGKSLILICSLEQILLEDLLQYILHVILFTVRKIHILSCRDGVKSWVNVYYWHGHSHVKDQCLRQGSERWESLTRIWVQMLTMCTENVRCSFIPPQGFPAWGLLPTENAPAGISYTCLLVQLYIINPAYSCICMQRPHPLFNCTLKTRGASWALQLSLWEHRPISPSCSMGLCVCHSSFPICSNKV